jgi:hypothetical protein
MFESIIAKIGIWNAWIFMSVFILQMIIVLCSNQEIRRRTHDTGVVRKTFIEKHIGIIANICWLMALVYSVFLPFRVNTIWFYIGCFIFILGVSFLSVATYNFMITPLD